MIYFLIKHLLKLYYKIIYFASAEGANNIPAVGGALLCGNHQQINDPLVMLSFIKRQPKFLGKAELFVPVLGCFLKKFGCVPVDRSKGDLKALRTCIKLLKEQNLLMLFPEGTRSCKHLADVKPGAIMFAIKSQVPIVPIGISRLKPFGRTKVTFGEPIYYDEYYDKKLTDDDYKKLVAELMYQIFNLVEEKCVYYDEIKASVDNEH